MSLRSRWVVASLASLLIAQLLASGPAAAAGALGLLAATASTPPPDPGTTDPIPKLTDADRVPIPVPIDDNTCSIPRSSGSTPAAGTR